MPAITQEQQDEPMTYEQIREMFREIGRAMNKMTKEADRRQEEAGRWQKEVARRQKEVEQSKIEADRWQKEAEQRWQKEADRRQEKADWWREEVARSTIQAELAMERLEQTVANVSRQLGGMANSDGDAAEEHFATSLASKMMFAGQHYDAIDFKVKRKLGDIQGEFDIVLSNGSAVAIIEVKHKACQADVEKLAATQAPNFRVLFPQYRDHAVYLGIGGMSFDDRVRAKAHELGIGILRQNGDTIEADTGHIRPY
jgi:hypothetical protein